MSEVSTRGRPSEYSESIASKLLYRIREGESVSDICKDDSMPSRSTIYYWLNDYVEFSDRYTQALQHRTHLLAEERHSILSDAIEQLSSLPENVNANVFGTLIKEKLRIIEWDAERLSAKRYKPKAEQDESKPQTPINLSFRMPTSEEVKAVKDAD